MIAVILVLFSGFFEETSSALAKRNLMDQKYKFYSIGFLDMFFAALIFWTIIAFKGAFSFNQAALPLFIIRAALEITLAHITFIAIRDADRSAYAFVRTLTLPILLVVDFVLGYSISSSKVFGILLILASLCLLFFKKGINKKGISFTLLTALLAVATISMFKYSITHWNTVEVDQGLMYLILAFYFFLLAFFRKERPLKSFKAPKLLLQSVTRSLASIIISFAYIFALASVVTTVKRAVAVMWAILSGHFYFREKGLGVKILALLLILTGLILLVV